MKILEAKGINKSFYPTYTLGNVDFDLEAGKMLALTGENGAGRSTLMNILLGIHKSASGSMQLDGKPYTSESPRDALQRGISMIHQELRLVPSMTVTDNMWIGRIKEFFTGGLYFPKRCMETTGKLFEEYGMTLSPRETVRNLSVAQVQMVEITRTISYRPRIVIMDEPTSALSDKEASVLYKIIRHLAGEETAIVFISYKLEKMFEVTDRVTISRNGQKISTGKVSRITMDSLIDGIAGRRAEDLYPELDVPAGDAALDMKNISRTGVFKNVSFQIRAGEILGSAGLVGSGRTEIVNGIYGIDPVSSEGICLERKRIQNKTPRQVLNNGVAVVTGDRLWHGVVTKVDVKIGMTLTCFYRVRRASFIDTGEEDEDVKNIVQSLHMKAAGIHMPIWSLPDENQRKMMVGRALLTSPKVLIPDEPTRGADVGVKNEIYDYCNQLTKQGMTIILISNDLPEVMGMGNRMLVMGEGKIVGRHSQGMVTAEQVMGKMFDLADHKDMEDEKWLWIQEHKKGFSRVMF